MTGASVTWTRSQYDQWLAELIESRGAKAPRTALGRAPHGLTSPLLAGVIEGFILGFPDDHACFEWPYAKDRDGYAYARVGSRASVRVHRFIYESVSGPIPVGLVLDHLCRNRGCVNPHHLEPVSHAANIQRGVGLAPLNAAKTHCKRGHPFDADNTRIRKTGRACRTCERNRVKRSCRSTVHSRASVTRAL